jgi:hypothetical protein
VHYHADVDANAAGSSYYAFRGPGANQGASEGTFEVIASQF